MVPNPPTVPFFTDSELACRCGRPECDAVRMDMDTVFKLEGLRREFGQPMHVNSARRCEFWNRHPDVKGAKDSQHLYGRAIDIRVPNAVYAMRLFELARKHGFTGIGVGKTFLHLDTRDGTPVLFGYKC